MGKHKKTETIHPKELSKFVAATKVCDEVGNATVFRIWEEDSDFNAFKIQLGDEFDGRFIEAFAFRLRREFLTKLAALFNAAARLS